MYSQQILNSCNRVLLTIVTILYVLHPHDLYYNWKLVHWDLFHLFLPTLHPLIPLLATNHLLLPNQLGFLSCLISHISEISLSQNISLTIMSSRGIHIVTSGKPLNSFSSLTESIPLYVSVLLCLSYSSSTLSIDG